MTSSTPQNYSYYRVLENIANFLSIHRLRDILTAPAQFLTPKYLLSAHGWRWDVTKATDGTVTIFVSSSRESIYSAVRDLLVKYDARTIKRAARSRRGMGGKRKPTSPEENALFLLGLLEWKEIDERRILQTILHAHNPDIHRAPANIYPLEAAKLTRQHPDLVVGQLGSIAEKEYGDDALAGVVTWLEGRLSSVAVVGPEKHLMRQQLSLILGLVITWVRGHVLRNILRKVASSVRQKEDVEDMDAGFLQLDYLLFPEKWNRLLSAPFSTNVSFSYFPAVDYGIMSTASSY